MPKYRRRGNFIERTKGRTPRNVKADLHFVPDYLFRAGKQQYTISFTVDILNFTNMLNSEWDCDIAFNIIILSINEFTYF